MAPLHKALLFTRGINIVYIVNILILYKNWIYYNIIINLKSKNFWIKKGMLGTIKFWILACCTHPDFHKMRDSNVLFKMLANLYKSTIVIKKPCAESSAFKMKK